jgi:hypothetical protein
MLSNPHNDSNLQPMRPEQVCFWPKIGAVLQKNGGPTEIILHFFSRFFGFSGFFPLQAIAVQWQTPIQPLQKKSCLKTYRRFFVRSGMCQNRRMRVENINWKTGRRAKKRRRDNFLPSCFCPYVFACKVEDASRLFTVKQQRSRSIGTATFPVLHPCSLAIAIPELSVAD